MTISILQIIIAVSLIVLILLQERSSGLSGLFGGGGGSDGGGFYQMRRGFEKIIFRGTIVLAIAFAGLAILQFLV